MEILEILKRLLARTKTGGLRENKHIQDYEEEALSDTMGWDASQRVLHKAHPQTHERPLKLAHKPMGDIYWHSLIITVK